jgi:hypothetical protein
MFVTIPAGDILKVFAGPGSEDKLVDVPWEWPQTGYVRR